MFSKWREKFLTKLQLTQVGDEEAKAKEQLIQEFHRLFDDDRTGTISNIEISIELRENAKPVFLKPYNVPITKRKVAEEELQKMVADVTIHCPPRI